MRDSVMSQKSDPAWQPDYERNGGHALEAPMISPDDIIGTGLPTKAAAIAAKLAGGKTGMGALGMLIGARGAGQLGEARIQDLLAKEMEASIKARRAGLDDRMKSNSGKELVHTGFDHRPFYEIGDDTLLPRRYQEFDKEVPLLDAWMIPERFQKAYGDRLSELKLVNSTADPVNSGSYDYANNTIMIGHGPSSNPIANEFFKQYPVAREQRIRQTMAHELGGHAMQGEERAINGTTPERLYQYLTDKPEPQLERHLLRSGYLNDIGNGADPFAIFQEYMKAGADNGTLAQLANYMKAMKDGRMTPEDALDQSRFHESSAKNLLERLNNKEKLQELIDKGITMHMPDTVQGSGKGYKPDVKMPQYDPADMYSLYRANAGEAQAESIGQRVGMSPTHRRVDPFQYESGIPLDFMHDVR
jgi:hypothetical protein